MSYYNGSQITQNNKLAVAGTTSDIILTILETLEIIRKSGSATSQNVIMAARKIRLSTT